MAAKGGVGLSKHAKQPTIVPLQELPLCDEPASERFSTEIDLLPVFPAD